MRLRSASLAAAALGLVTARAASADVDASVRVDVVPDGAVRSGAMGESGSDLPAGYAAGAELRYVTQTYAIGIAPRFVQLRGAPDVVHEVDLAARIAGRRELTASDTVELHFALGYSLVGVPGDDPVWPDGNDARGVFAGTGMAYVRRLASRFSIMVEAGYQYGFQARTSSTDRELVAPRFLHAGVGVRIGF
jgi:hypothetical protein